MGQRSGAGQTPRPRHAGTRGLSQALGTRASPLVEPWRPRPKRVESTESGLPGAGRPGSQAVGGRRESAAVLTLAVLPVKRCVTPGKPLLLRRDLGWVSQASRGRRQVTGWFPESNWEQGEEGEPSGVPHQTPGRPLGEAAAESAFRPGPRDFGSSSGLVREIKTGFQHSQDAGRASPLNPARREGSRRGQVGGTS